MADWKVALYSFKRSSIHHFLGGGFQRFLLMFIPVRGKYSDLTMICVRWVGSNTNYLKDISEERVGVLIWTAPCSDCPTLEKKSSAEERILHGKLYHWMLEIIIIGSILFIDDGSSPEWLIEKNHIYIYIYIGVSKIMVPPNHRF